MLPNVQTEYLKLCEKGYQLYLINCDACHTQKVKGKKIVPDFTEEQMGAYSIRIANATHESKMSEIQLTSEELSLITTFLKYKKKNE